MQMSTFILLTLSMAIVTVAIRFSVIAFAGSFEMSPRLKKTLRFVPVTVLPAIIALEILGTGSEIAFNLENPKVLAAIICTLVSLRFDLVWVVVSGVASLLLFQAIL